MAYGGEVYDSRTKAGIFIALGIAVIIAFSVLAFQEGKPVFKSVKFWMFMGIGVVGGLWLMGGEFFSLMYDGTAKATTDTFHNWGTLIEGHPSTAALSAHAHHRVQKAALDIVDKP